MSETTGAERLPPREELRLGLLDNHADPVEVFAGSRRLWWKLCAGALREDREWLASDEPTALIAAARDRTDGSRLADDAMAQLAAVRAASGIAPDRVSEDLCTAIRRWREAGSLPRDLPPDDGLERLERDNDPGLTTALRHLAGLRPGPARTMVALIVALIAGRWGNDADRAEHSVATHVLFDADPGGSTVAGAAGRLEITCLPDGPPGLFPDPRVMSFFHADPDFQKALTQAWKSAFRPADPKPCLLWTLTATDPTDGRPVAELSGASAGAAFAVLLTAQRLRLRPPRRLVDRVTRARTLRGRVALTGAVDEHGGIGAVGGLAAKLTVAARQALTPIVPAANHDYDGTAPASVEPYRVNTVAEAHRRATQMPHKHRRIAIGGGIVTLVAAIAASSVFVVVDRRADLARQEKIATNLIAAAREQRDLEPGLAALLAAQAVAQAPEGSPRSGATQELLRQLAYSGSYTGEITGNDRAITATAVVSTGQDIVIGGTADGRLFGAYRSARVVHTRQGQAHLSAVNQIAVSPVIPSSFVTAGDDAPGFWTITDGRITAGPAVQRTNRNIGAVWSVAYSPDGTVVAAGDNEGWLTLLDASTGALLADIRPHTEIPVRPAAVTAVAFGPPGSGTLYAGTAANRLLAVDYRPLTTTPRGKPTTKVVDLPDRGPVRALALVPDAGWYVRSQRRAGALLIGTDQGLQSWDLEAGREAAAFPTAGVVGAVRSLTVRGPRVAVGQERRTVVVAHETASDGRAERHLFGIRSVRDGSIPGASLYDDGLLTPALGGRIRVWDDKRRPLTGTSLGVSKVDDVGVEADGSVVTLEFGSLTRSPDGRRSESLGTATSAPNIVNRPAVDDLLALPPTDDIPVLVVGDTEERAAEPLAVVDRDDFSKIDVPDQEHLLSGCGGVTAVAFLAVRPARFAVGCASGLVQLWDPAGWQFLSSTRLPHGVPSAFAVIGDALIVGGRGQYPGNAAGTLSRAPLADLSSMSTGPANRDGVTAVAAIGDRVVVGGADGAVRAYSATLQPLSDPVTVGGRVHDIAAATVHGRVVAAVDHGLALLDADALTVVATVPVGQPVSRIAVDPAGRTLAGTLEPAPSPYAVAGAELAEGESAALTWKVDSASLIGGACDLGGRELTAAEVRRFSGEPAAALRKQCAGLPPRPATSAPGPETAGPDGTTPGGVLITATGAAVPRVSDECDPLITGNGECGVLLGGERDYAWAKTTGPADAADPQNYKHRMVLYRGTPDGKSWVPVLQTNDSWAGVFIQVRRMSDRSGERTFAIEHHRVSRIERIALDLVTEGRIELSLSDVRAEPYDDGLHIWAGVHTPADPDCCPSNWVTYVLRRNADGTWSEHGRQATTADQIPPIR
jgi:WD40 repeat protein